MVIGKKPVFSILNTYGRCLRIVRDQKEMFPVDPDAFSEESSRRLYASYIHCRGQVSSESSIDELLTAFLSMLDPINTFFDDVLVMAEDETQCDNRLGILQRIAAFTKGVADLARLEGF